MEDDTKEIEVHVPDVVIGLIGALRMTTDGITLRERLREFRTAHEKEGREIPFVSYDFERQLFSIGGLLFSEEALLNSMRDAMPDATTFTVGDVASACHAAITGWMDSYEEETRAAGLA